MKLIGTIPDRYDRGERGWIVEIDGTELGILVNGEPREIASLYVGTTLAIGDRWRRDRQLENVQARLEALVCDLRKLADDLENQKLIVPPKTAT